METKKCRSCGIEKTLSHEYWNYRESSSDGFQSYCFSCDRKISSINQHKLGIKNKKIVMHYYSKGKSACACCGEANLIFLCIDHVNGNGNVERPICGKGASFYKWLIKQGFPKGYQVLCYNCNNAKGKSTYCPHQVGADAVDLEYF